MGFLTDDFDNWSPELLFKLKCAIESAVDPDELPLSKNEGIAVRKELTRFRNQLQTTLETAKARADRVVIGLCDELIARCDVFANADDFALKEARPWMNRAQRDIRQHEWRLSDTGIVGRLHRLADLRNAEQKRVSCFESTIPDLEREVAALEQKVATYRELGFGDGVDQELRVRRAELELRRQDLLLAKQAIIDLDRQIIETPFSKYDAVFAKHLGRDSLAAGERVLAIDDKLRARLVDGVVVDLSRARPGVTYQSPSARLALEN